jgi:ABC-type nitrate/sulfonate/bicarbonate transport system permease component
MMRRSKAWIAPALLITIWQTASWAGLTNQMFFPPPSKLLAAAWRLTQAGVLQRHIAASVGRTLAAFFIGSASGIAFGLTLSLFGGLRNALKPLLSASLTIPKVTLLPLFMLLLGMGEPALIMPATATCFVVCALHALDAALGIDRHYVELARNYGAGRWEQVRYVFLPASLPRLFTGLRVALGAGLVLTLSTEMLISETGIGGMIWMGWQTLSIDNLLVGVLAAALLGLLFQTLLDKLELALIPWSRIGAMTALLLVLAMAPAGLQAQTTGTVEGTVVDPAGRPVPNAKLLLREIGTQVQRAVPADSQGYFVASGMKPGEYELEASSPGFVTQVQRGILLSAGSSVRANVRLAIGETRETVQVIAETPLVAVSAADWGGTVWNQKLESLPLNGRDMFDLAAQQPGSPVTTQSQQNMTTGGGLHLSVNGLRPSQNGFRIDGIYVDDATGSAPSSAGGRLLGIEGTEELRLITSPFSAEYGRAAGAILTAVSKSGANQWHGSAYEYLRNSAMDARNFFDPQNQPIPPFRRNQFGGLFSGPLKKNRLFFLLNYEAIRQDSAQTTVATTLSDAGRTGNLGTTQVTVSNAVKPFLALFPIANGPQFSDGTAVFLAPDRRVTPENYGAGKLDAILSDHWRLASRITWDNGSTNSQDPMQTVELSGSSRYQFAHNELQFQESPSMIHTFRAGFSRIVNGETAQDLPRIPAGLNVVPGQTIGDISVTGLTEVGGTEYRQRPREYADNDYQLGHQMTYARGRHTILAGGSFDRIQANERADQDAVGLYRFNSVAQLLTGQPSQFDYMAAGSDTVRGWRSMLFTGFVQDTWRVSANWQVMAGVRYEAVSVPTEVNGKIATIPNPLQDKTVTVGGPLYQNPSKRNFAPRASTAWDVGGKGKTVFRAGAGIFFDLPSSRDLLISGVRMPPFYLRPLVSNPVFPNAVAALNAAGSGSALLAMDSLTYSPQQPYVLQFQASWQHQLSPHTVASVTYAGSRGIHLTGYIGNIDTPVPSFTAGGTAYFAPGAPKLNPAFGRIGMRTTQFDSYSHSLQGSVQRRMAHGFRLEGSYTFSKSIDDASSPIFDDFLTTDLVPVFRLRDNRGRSDFDVRHDATLNASWSAPRLHGGPVARFLAAWELHGLMRLQSGFPFNPFTGFDRTGLGDSTDGGQRPDLIAAPDAKIILGNPQHWFDPNAFALQPAGYFGNLGRNTFTGPGLFDLDLATHKTLWAGERLRVTLRVEAFNVTNHSNFQVPSGLAVFNSSGQRVSSAGQITATATNSRQMQMALRLDF